MTNDDTICAISTPPGTGGIAVIRVSGPKAITICDTIWHGKRLSETPSHNARYGIIVDPVNGELDRGLATVFRAPNSFTGEDVVELSVHGSKWIQNELVQLLIKQGCRMATEGEFTRRAFSSGRIDLVEAEAIADMIASSSRASHHIAVSQMRGDLSNRLVDMREKLIELASLLELELDFSEEDVEFASRDKLLVLARQTMDMMTKLTSTFSTGSALKDGVPVAIVGETNAGKSTLLNKLLHEERAIVSDIHGTTRDTIEDTIEIDGTLFRFIDTAGLRDTADPIETIGIQRAHEKIRLARIILWVIDPTSTTDPAQTAADITSCMATDAKLIAVINKCDLDAPDITPELTNLLPGESKTIRISASQNQGLDHLRTLIVDAAGFARAHPGEIMLTNLRHFEALTNATQSIARVITGLQTGLSGDFIAQDLRETLHYIGEITGSITTPQILSTIFSRFCIGK